MLKQLLLSLIFIVITVSFLSAQDKPEDKPVMKNYFMVFLKKGANRTQDSIEVEKIQESHLANIRRLGNEGKLIVAGPFLDDGDLRGIFIFDVTTLEEVKNLCETDPAIKSGRLSYEIHPWMTQKGVCLK